MRLPDGDGERRDAEVIETSRPDTKKAEEEKYRIIVVMHIPGIDVLNPPTTISRKTSPGEGGSRARTNVHAHLRQGHLPPAGHLRHREIPRRRRFFDAPDRQCALVVSGEADSHFSANPAHLRSNFIQENGSQQVLFSREVSQMEFCALLQTHCVNERIFGRPTDRF